MTHKSMAVLDTLQKQNGPAPLTSTLFQTSGQMIPHRKREHKKVYYLYNEVFW